MQLPHAQLNGRAHYSSIQPASVRQQPRVRRQEAAPAVAALESRVKPHDLASLCAHPILMRELVPTVPQAGDTR